MGQFQGHRHALRLCCAAFFFSLDTREGDYQRSRSNKPKLKKKKRWRDTCHTSDARNKTIRATSDYAKIRDRAARKTSNVQITILFFFFLSRDCRDNA